MSLVKNIGSTDQKYRYYIGGAIVLYGVIAQSLLGIVGLVLIATAALRWCPVYKPFDIDTSR